MDAEWLRYYLAAKMNSRVEDVDFTKSDFAQRVNSDLIGKYVNIASRAAGFIFKKFEGRVDDSAMQDPLLEAIRSRAEEVKGFFEIREFARATRLVMELADKINEFVDQEKPWELAKNPEARAELHRVSSDRPRRLPPAHALPQARAARHGHPRRGLPLDRTSHLGERLRAALLREPDQGLQAPDAARRHGKAA